MKISRRISLTRKVRGIIVPGFPPSHPADADGKSPRRDGSMPDFLPLDHPEITLGIDDREHHYPDPQAEGGRDRLPGGLDERGIPKALQDRDDGRSRWLLDRPPGRGDRGDL